MKCNKCQLEKVPEAFHAKKKICKECRKAYSRANYYKIAEKLSVRRKEIRSKKKDELNQKARDRYWKNRESLLEKARKRPSYRKVDNEKANTYRLKNLDKARARQAVSRALKNGRLIKPFRCSLCNSEEKLDAHHADYERHLDVVWVCRTCHKKLHSKFFKTTMSNENFNKENHEKESKRD